jgi:hypothetical protein
MATFRCSVTRDKGASCRIVGEAEIRRAGRATRDQLVNDRQEKGLRLAGLPEG